MNPDLIAPGAPDPTHVVQPLKALTPAFAVQRAKEKRYYVCSVPSASMHRKDGMKLAFVNGFFETDLLHDIQYIEEEMQLGNSYIREATPEEIEAQHMRRDPVGTIEARVREKITAEVTAKVESDLRHKLEVELKEKYRTEGRMEVASSNANKRPQSSTSGTGGKPVDQAELERSHADGAKLAGTDVRGRVAAAQAAHKTQLLEADAAKQETVVKPLMESKPSGLNPQNSNDIKDAARS